MTEVSCERCGLTVDIQHKEGDQFSYAIEKADLGRCAVIHEKVAEEGKADIRFLCPDLKAAIESAVAEGKLARVN
jgi:hypothetical protein